MTKKEGRKNRAGQGEGCRRADARQRRQRSLAAKQNDIVRELVGQFPQEQIHTHRITIGHDQEARFTSQRLHCSIGVPVLPYMVARHAGTGSFFTPAVFGLVDPSETSFILEHQAYFSTISSAIVDFRLQFLHFFFNFFEVSMTSSLAFFGCLLRGITFLQPCRRST